MCLFEKRYHSFKETMKHTIYIAILLFSFQAYGQKKPFKEIIETDSSTIEIIRNSVYRCYEETYKYNDSIWWNVTYIDDTTQLYTEGWKLKSGKHLGIWKEYNRQGELMYTWNHEAGICEVNKSHYPYHDLLEQMKRKADSLIISAYSQEFFDNHVRFNFDCYAYNGHWTNLSDGEKYFMKAYSGSWTEPMKSKPNSFKFRYSVKIGETDWYPEMIGIDLDSLGNYVPSSDDTYNRYGFEDVKGNKRTFNIDVTKAIKKASQYGLVITDTTEISEFLTWENFKKQEFYNGQFRYYITELTSKTEYTEGTDRQGIIFRFNVYSFNPWTGEFIEKKKMKSRKEWGPLSGHSTGLMPDNE